MNTCATCDTQLPADAAFCPECGTRLEAALEAPALATLGGLSTIGEESTRGRRSEAPTLEPGTRLADRYVIGARIGAGGMGVVYRARDEVTEREVALKLIRPERVDGPGEVERLVAEGVTARDVRHSNVVAVYDVGVAEGQPYLSMELVEGRSLRAWHREMRAAGKDVPYPVVRRIVLELLGGLEAAHAAGVIHRDLKPENVILTAEPTEERAPLKILDFGIARAGGTSSGTGSGTGLGTPHYMAPEQITSPDLAGPPADLYSLSVLFYELLVDVLPQGHWQAPSGGRSDVPASVDALIERGLSNRPASRPQDAEAYRQALASSGSNLLDAWKEGWKGSWWRRWDTSVLRERRSWWIAAAAILVLGGIGALLPEEYLGLDQVEPEYGGEIESVVHEDDDFASPVDPPEPELHAEMSPEDLSGAWFDGYGGVFDVEVSRMGRVRGEGMSLDGYPLELRGRLRDGHFTYQLYSAQGMKVAEGGGSWDGGTHVTYETRTLNGVPNLAGVFHVNHEPE